MEPIVWFFLSFVVLMIIRMPLYLCLLSSSVLYLVLSPDLSMMTALAKMMNAPNSFTLLAVPFFIFAAQVMNTGGVSDRIFGFAKKIIGHHKGGLAYVNILDSFIFSGISGSALADVGGLGMIEIRAMRNAGYDDDFIIGLTGASATVGPIIPPSIPFVIYAAMANVSVGGLFLAGVVPGVLLCVIQALYIFIVAKKRNYPIDKKATLKEIVKSFLDALPALLFPIILLGGIWTGWFTPTEAALVSIVYGMAVSFLFYKDLKIKHIPGLLKETIQQLAPSIAVVVSASLFAWVLTYEKIDQVIVKAILSVTHDRFLILLFINIMLLFLGMFIEVIAAILITLPILTPLMAVAHIHPIHMGVILVLNMMIGLLTPPVGFSLYMLATVSKRPFNDVVKMCFPWVLLLIGTLLLVTYIEPLSMWLPRLMGLA